jgi:hypothetical protein
VPGRGVHTEGTRYLEELPVADTDEPDPHRDDTEPDVERAEEIYEEVAATNPDPTTRREAVEGLLDDEGLSDAGGAVGEHNE